MRHTFEEVRDEDGHSGLFGEPVGHDLAVRNSEAKDVRSPARRRQLVSLRLAVPVIRSDLAGPETCMTMALSFCSGLPAA